jgi:hypothetical protein
MASIGFVIDQIKRQPQSALYHLPVHEVCQLLGFSFRDRTLDPATVVVLFIKQILHGNSSCAQVRHLGKQRFSAQAYCQARQRLPLAVLQTLCRRLCDAARQRGAPDACQLFLAHRVFVVDGSSFSMPDTPALQDQFGQPGRQKAGCGFPVAHLLAMFDLNTGMLTEAIASPLRTHDLKRVSELHPRLRPGDLLLGDTAFGSYAHFALLLQAKLHGLMPLHQCRIADFTPHRPYVRQQEVEDDTAHLPRSRWIKSLGSEDQLVEWFKPKSRPKHISKQEYDRLPDSIIVRELRRRVYRPELDSWVELIIVTTLLDEQIYPAAKLVELRLRRWQVEVNLRHLKTTMGLQVLKCKSVDGVMKELAVFALLYNLVRLIMLEASARQKTTPDRISFKDVLGWVRVARINDPMPRFIVNSHRPGRLEPRAVKRRPKEYDRMNRPRSEMQNELKKQGQTSLS